MPPPTVAGGTVTRFPLRQEPFPHEKVRGELQESRPVQAQEEIARERRQKEKAERKAQRHREVLARARVGEDEDPDLA